MTWFALAALVLYFLLAFGLRSWLHWRRTGSAGFRGISGGAGSAEWFGGVLFIVALAGLIAAPVADLLGWLQSVPVLGAPAFRAAGVALVAGGMAGTLWAQHAMGDAWRIGVDERERTPLVVNGPFRCVRNPIFTSMALAAGGMALLVPNVASALALVALITALQLQVRVVEEPYLARAHGPGYLTYAARTGRFLPGIGRLEAVPMIIPDEDSRGH
jgi:protein-S-isoprenylcysteine O-methyltransferase Ste14